MGYSKEVYQQSMQILEDRRRTNRDRLLSRKSEISIKIPEIDNIQKKMVQTATGITKAVVNNPSEAASLIRQLSEENLSLQKNREQLLEQNGYPKDYLAEHFYCTLCRDTGYVGTQKCSCFEKILKQQASAQLNFVCSTSGCGFDRFDLNFYPTSPDADGVVPRERMKDILNFTQDYARNFSLSSPNILMLGRTGLGKTHLSLSIATEITDRGFGVLYTPVQKLMDKLESRKFSYSQEDKAEYSSNMESVLNCDLLILDDLGTEFITTFTTSVLYNIVNSRLVDQKPTIINTNLEPNQLEKIYSQRMASRLSFEYKILRFYGSDVRFLTLKQKHMDRNNN